MSRKKLYGIWYTMHSRCYRENCISFKNYGARGITICEEWRNSFERFYEWAIKNGYNESLSIDRIDNSKGYSPDNCRWATRKEQANNQRSNHLITYNGRTQTMKQWAEELGITYTCLRSRINTYKYSIEKAFEISNLHEVSITYKGKTQNLKTWCRELELNYGSIRSRIVRGWDPIKALEKPLKIVKKSVDNNIIMC